MSRRKQAPHRLGFRDQRDDPTLAPYIRTADDIREHARWLWLMTVAGEIPDVLGALAAVSDESGIDAWAARWHLTAPWCLAYARSTWRQWQRTPLMRRSYWMNRDDFEGALVDSGAPLAARPLKDAQHLNWLAWRVCLVNDWNTIAIDAGRTIQTVRGACLALARLIELPLPTRARGRPPQR